MFSSVAAHLVLFVSLIIPLISLNDLLHSSLFVSWVFWLSGAAAITQSLNGGLNCGYVTSTDVSPLLTPLHEDTT